MALLRGLRTALLDLVAPTVCVGCGADGALACRGCLAPLTAAPRVAWPTPSPAGLPRPYAVAAYDGGVREVVVAYKERAAVSLAPALAAALARAIAAAAGGGPVRVVPVPSSPRARRARGYDHVALLARRAAVTLRAAGSDVRVVPALRHARRVLDSAGLSAADRARNMSGSLAARPRATRELAGHRVVLVDDLVTTGATLAEAARALRAAGVEPVAAAAVAATRRRSAGAGVGVSRNAAAVGLHKPGSQV